jgi:hypothetical protein
MEVLLKQILHHIDSKTVETIALDLKCVNVFLFVEN